MFQRKREPRKWKEKEWAKKQYRKRHRPEGHEFILPTISSYHCKIYIAHKRMILKTAEKYGMQRIRNENNMSALAFSLAKLDSRKKCNLCLQRLGRNRHPELCYTHLT